MKKGLLSSLVVLVALFSLVLAPDASGQDTRTVSGTVTDAETGDPLPGVNIIAKGTTIGTATDAAGSYELAVPSTADSLVFSFIGYVPQTVSLAGRSVIDVQLAQDVSTLGEVVVVGYGTQRRVDLTGSIDVVDVEEMAKIPTGEVLKQLQGQVSGVSIISSGQPGEEPRITIRGYNTFGNNEPLYIVDGIPTQNIETLNPNNIASMQVLKDAGAASIYGSRASNGVIIITTKEGSGGVTVNYSAYVGYQVPETNNVWDNLSAREMGEMAFLADRNTVTYDDEGNPDPVGTDLYGFGSEPTLPDYIIPNGAKEGSPAVDPSRYFVNPHYNDPSAISEFYRITRANKEGTNWYDAIVDPALTTKHDLSVGGGSEIGNYFLSLGYLNQQGTVMQTYQKRYTIRANTNFNVNDDIRIGENLAYTVTDNPTIDGLTEGSAIGYSFRIHPLIPVHDIMGNFGGGYGTNLGNAENPVAIQYRNRNNEGQDKRLFGNVFAEVDLFEDLLFRSNFGGEVYSGYFHSFTYPEYENPENNSTVSYSENAWNGYTWTWSNTLTYQHTFADRHDLEVLVGAEAHENTGREVGGTTEDYFSFDPDYWNLDTGSGTQTNYSFQYGTTLFSLFGRLDYSYAGKYLLGVTLRRDGSSKFLNDQYGVFPAVSLGWRISEESFMQNVDWLTSLKLRGSYGVMGNQFNVDADNAYTLFQGDMNSSFYPITGCNNCLLQGFEQAQIGNPEAKWERDIQMNIGFDVALFDGQLEATVDYYEKNIDGLLFNPALPGAAGTADQPFINVGSMTNNGIDASIRGTTTLFGELNLNAGLSFTTYNNEIVKIAEGFDFFDSDSRRFGTSFIRNAVGHPTSAFYGYKIIGFWDTEDEIREAGEGYQEGVGFAENPLGEVVPTGLGHFRYADVDGDGQITTADRTFLGSPHPNFSYGLNLALTYRNWDFSMFLYGTQGNEIWNQVKWWTDFYASFRGAKSSTALYDSWTPDNHDATVAIQEEVQSFGTYGVPNSYFVEDGSYLRAKSIQLGYTLPAQFVQGVGINTFRVYVQVANAFTITGYSGPDPEIGGGGVSFGIDEGQYANARQFLVGIDLTF